MEERISLPQPARDRLKLWHNVEHKHLTRRQAPSIKTATVRARTWTWGFVSTAMSFFLEERFTSDTSCGPPLNGVTGEE